MLGDLAIVGTHLKLLLLLYGVVDLTCSGSSQLVVILSDEVCHALTGMFLWSAIIVDSMDAHACSLETLRKACVRQFAGNSKEILLAGFASCALDVDHFIAAGSASLSDATSLPHRPFGHALAFPAKPSSSGRYEAGLVALAHGILDTFNTHLLHLPDVSSTYLDDEVTIAVQYM
eukprot:gene38364-46623_t